MVGTGFWVVGERVDGSDEDNDELEVEPDVEPPKESEED